MANRIKIVKCEGGDSSEGILTLRIPAHLLSQVFTCAVLHHYDTVTKLRKKHLTQHEKESKAYAKSQLDFIRQMEMLCFPPWHVKDDSLKKERSISQRWQDVNETRKERVFLDSLIIK